MQRKSFVLTAALVMGLVLGIVFSPMLRSSSASAQTNPPAQTQTAGPLSSLASSFLDKLAAALNIQRSALDSAIVSAGNSTADESVANGTLTQAQADQLKARVQAGDYGSLFGGRGGKGGRQFGAVQQAIVTAAAQTLNLTEDALRTQLRAGQTLAQIAQAQGTTEQAVIDAALAAAKTQLDQLVAGGTVTQAQADAYYAELQARGADIIRSHGRGHSGRGDFDVPAAPTTPQTPSATVTPDA